MRLRVSLTGLVVIIWAIGGLGKGFSVRTDFVVEVEVATSWSFESGVVEIYLGVSNAKVATKENSKKYIV